MGSLAAGGLTDHVSQHESALDPSLSIPFPSLPFPPPFLPTVNPTLTSPLTHPSLPFPPFLPTVKPTLTSPHIHPSSLVPPPFLPTVNPTLTSPPTHPTLSATSNASSLTHFVPTPSISPPLISSMITSPKHTVSTHTVSDTTSAPMSSRIMSTEAKHKTTSDHTSLLSTTSTSTTYSPSPSIPCDLFADGASDCSASVSSPPPLLSNSTSPIVTAYRSGIPSPEAPEATTTVETRTSTMTVVSTTSSYLSVAVPSRSATNAASQSDPSTPMVGAITGGTIGAVTILGLLIYIVMRHRSRKIFSLTPFNISSTESPPPVPSRNPKYERMRTDAGRPNSAASSFIQHSDSCLAEFESRSRCASCNIDPAASFMCMSEEDERASASTIARRHRAHELDKLYPHTRFRTTDRFDSGENWIEQVVTVGDSREPSEELPAYPRSTKSQKSTIREADRGDDYFVLPSSYPLPPELHLSLNQ